MQVPEPVRRVGPYRLIQRLGAGCMGTVFEAVHERTGARYALKLLTPRHPEDLARFRREAALTARLDHEAIVRVHDLGLERAPYYIAMDLIAGGRTLQSRLDREGPLPVAEAVDVAARLAGALWHAHALGVVHRDVKPANILLDAAGLPRLADFGLARDGGAVLERLTLTGEIVGTPRYIAPEQARDSRAVDGRADVYALGGVLFCMLTGQPPMPGDDVATVFRNVERHVPPPPSSLRPEVPRALDAICARALAKRPEERFASAAELLEALEAARPAPPRPAADGRRPPPRRRALPALVGVASLAAVAGVVALVSTRAERVPSAPTAATTTPPPPVEREAPPARPRLTLPSRPDAPLRAPWTLRSLEQPLALTITRFDGDDDADASVVETASLLLRARDVDASGDRATAALEVTQALAWDGGAVVRREAAHAPHQVAGLVGGRLRCALVLSSGEPLEVALDDALAAAVERLGAQDGALRALLEPGALAALLGAVARATPMGPLEPATIGGVGLADERLAWALVEGALDAGGDAPARVVVHLAAVDLRAPAGPGVDALQALVPGGLGDMATLWLLNGLPPLDRPSAPRELLIGDASAFGAPELVRAERALPTFATPWGPVVGTLRAGDLLVAHERRGGWRKVCLAGAACWVLDRGGALTATPNTAETVVVTDARAFAYPNAERRSGTAVGVAPRGAGFVVRGRADGDPRRGPHLEIDYGGARCWILERDTRPLD